jgi:Skp family chaperone for outer membrane proteins
MAGGNSMKKIILTSVAAVALVLSASAQTATQDMKNAGSETKQAAKDTGKGVAKGAKKTGKAVKHTTHKAAKKVEQKTQ